MKLALVAYEPIPNSCGGSGNSSKDELVRRIEKLYEVDLITKKDIELKIKSLA